MVYSIESSATENEKKLMEMSFGNNSHTKYISFKYTSSNNKVSALYLNNMINIKVRFETLHNINVLEQASFKEKIGSLREILLSIQYNSITIHIVLFLQILSDSEKLEKVQYLIIIIVIIVVILKNIF